MGKATAVAFAPAHITGFFEICDSRKNPLLKGSKGAGISLSKGVFTRVRLAKGRNGLEIRINGKVSRAPVSRAVLKRFNWEGMLNVDHKIQVPMGSGFGTSGAGALSLSLAMNSLLGNQLTKLEAARIAHLADIDCKTGLGTVIGEFAGGFEVRIKAGAPGIGKVVKLPTSKNTEIICLWFGPRSKPAALSSHDFRKAVNAAGRGAVQKLLRNPALFPELSRKFAESLPGLINKKMRKVLDECDRAELPCSVMMIGRSLFALTRTRDDKRVLLSIFRKHAGPKGKIILAQAEIKGARILREDCAVLNNYPTSS